MDVSGGDLQARQGRDKRALAFAVLPISTAGMAMWIGVVAARGGNPMNGFGNVGAVDIVAMVAVGWLCRIVVANRGQSGATPPLGLQIVFALIVALAWGSLAACASAALNRCGGKGCGDTIGFLSRVGSSLASLLLLPASSRSDLCASPCCRRKRKVFFFEKKKQKTFATLTRPR